MIHDVAAANHTFYLLLAQIRQLVLDVTHACRHSISLADRVLLRLILRDTLALTLKRIMLHV